MQQWRYRLKFNTAVNVFSGLAVAGLVDRMVMRNQIGLPYIPGSTVKGRWRYTAERLIRGGELPAILDSLKFHGEQEPICKTPENSCTICRLFGNDALPGLLWVGQAELEECWRILFIDLLNQNRNPVVHTDVELRPGIALKRLTRTVLEDNLFFDEAVPPVHFEGAVIMHGEISQAEWHFLQAAARLVANIGGRKNVGRGILEGGIQLTIPESAL